MLEERSLTQLLYTKYRISNRNAIRRRTTAGRTAHADAAFLRQALQRNRRPPSKCVPGRLPGAPFVSKGPRISIYLFLYDQSPCWPAQPNGETKKRNRRERGELTISSDVRVCVSAVAATKTAMVVAATAGIAATALLSPAAVVAAAAVAAATEHRTPASPQLLPHVSLQACFVAAVCRHIA